MQHYPNFESEVELGWSTTAVLRALVLACLVSLVASNLVALVVFVRTSDENPTHSLLAHMDQLQGTRLQVTRVVMPLNDYLISPEPRFLEAYRRQLRELEARLEVARQHVGPELAAQVDTSLANLVALGTRIEALPLGPERAAAATGLMEGFDGAGERLVADLDVPMRALQAELEQNRGRNDALRARASLLVFGIGAINALGLGLMLVVSRSLSRRLRHLIDRTRRAFAAHHTEPHAPLAGHERDELGELARSIDTARHTRDATVRTERLAAIGELAVAMRHEINNPLQAITLISENIRDQAKERGDERLQEACELLQQGCGELHERVHKLTEVLDGPSVRYAGQERMKDIRARAPKPGEPPAPEPDAAHAGK